MGCSGSKNDQVLRQHDSDEGSTPEQQSSNGTAQQSGTPDKTKTFRERRLSMSQMQSQEQNQQRRRLSVYGGSGEDGAVPSVVTSPMPSVGCKTMGGFEPVPGGSTAKINQDRGVAIWPYLEDESVGLFGVYDGHGRAGEKVSEFVLQNLPGTLESKKDKLWADPGEALSKTYVEVDEALAKSVDASVSGTTAVTCLIKDKHLWLANSGDSRAVVLRRDGKGLKAIDLTIDHKPDSPNEMKRILSMGGHVTPVRMDATAAAAAAAAAVAPGAALLIPSMRAEPPCSRGIVCLSWRLRRAPTAPHHAFGTICAAWRWRAR